MRPSLLIITALTAIASQAAPLRLWYDRPAQFFEEAIVIGNGKLGAIIYAGPEVDRINLNDITLWTGEPEKGVTTPDAHNAIPAIRQALDRGDYSAADSLQRKVQGHYSENYQPLGSLTVTHHGHRNITDYHRELDLDCALASTEYSVDGHPFTTEYIASSPDSVIALRFTTNVPGGLDFTLALSSQLPATTVSTGSRIVSDGYAAYHSLPVYYHADPHHFYDPERGIHFRTIVAADAPSSIVTSNPDGTLSVKGGNEATVYITNATSFNGFDRDPATDGRPYTSIADRNISRALSSSFDSIQRTHETDYRNLFHRVSLSLGNSDASLDSIPTDRRLLNYSAQRQHDPDLEALYFQFGRYLLISSSRTPGVPANLQGLWCESILPPWSSNYTSNINLEENYWPANTTNLSELHLPLITFIDNLTHSGERSAKAYYGVPRGWCLGQNTDIWAMTNPVGLNTGHPMWANWTMGGAWLASHIWDHYTFRPDTAFLNRYYPAMKGAAEFCLSWLIESPEGKLITSPGTSPENLFKAPDGSHAATSAGSTSDLAITRQCLADTRLAALTLGVDADLIAEIDSVLPRLVPYRIGRKGNLCEWPEDFDDVEPTHRHQSHLYGLFPGRHIDPATTPDLARAAARTLEIKGDETTGWSTGWRVNLYARLRDAESAYRIYRRLLRYVSPDQYKGDDAYRGGGTYPNLLDAHSPFQIDGNFGGTAGVAEMLLQSTPDTITLLPAIPDRWKVQGRVEGLLARGGWTLTYSWRNGKVTDVTLRSEGPATTTLLVNGLTIPVSHTTSNSTTLRL